MLIDSDDDSVVDIFPAIPYEWEYQKVAFDGLMTSGALSFSAERDLNGVNVIVTNKATTTRERKLRIKVPRFMEVLEIGDFAIEDGFITINTNLQPGETKTYQFNFGIPTDINTIKADVKNSQSFKIYPNPNSTGTMNLTNSEDIDELRIYSMSGRLVRNFKNNANVFNINGLESGVYIVQIKTGKEFYIRKLIVGK
jgi:hypothetical protein